MPLSTLHYTSIRTDRVNRRWQFMPFPSRWELTSTQSVLLGLILSLAALVYAHSFSNTPVWDDHDFLHYSLVGSPSFFWRSFAHDIFWFRSPGAPPQTPYYRPIEDIWFGVNRALFGTNLVAWHVAKIGVWVLGVAMSFRLAQLLSSDAWVGLCTALLFAVLPVHVEAVTWLSAIPEPLSAIFEMASLCWFIASRGRRRWTGALILYSAAIFTHESALLFPCLIILSPCLFGTGSGQDDTAPQSASHMHNRRLQEGLLLSLPFIAIAVVYLVLRLWVLGPRVFVGIRHEQVVSLAGMFATIPVVFLQYLHVLVIPWSAGPLHRVPFVQHPTSAGCLFPLAILVGIVICTFIAYQYYPHPSLLLFCIVWFLVNLAPAMNLRQVTAPIQDRFIYTSSFAWCLLLADSCAYLARRRLSYFRLAVTSLAFFTIVCIPIVWRLQRVWHDDIILFGTCVTLWPDNPQYRSRFISALLEHGQLDAAVQNLVSLSAAYPMDIEMHVWLSSLYTQMKRPDDATREARVAAHLLTLALVVHPTDRHLHIELGELYARMHRLGDAMREFQTADTLADQSSGIQR